MTVRRPARPDPKPEKRIHDPAAGRAKCLSEGRCRICGAPGIYYTDPNPYSRTRLTRHHLVRRGRGGDDVDDNLVPVCGDGTHGCHGDIERWDLAARRALRSHLLRPEIDYILSKRSRDWLDRSYPEA